MRRAILTFRAIEQRLPNHCRQWHVFRVDDDRMNIYVGNLPYRMSDDELRNLFTPFGEVASAKIIMDKMTDRSKGFGFVEMPDNSAAETAIREVNGKDMGGRPLRVNEAKPRENAPRPRFRNA